MILLRGEDDWKELKLKLPAQYNCPHATVNGIPKEFPCLLKTYLYSGVNGVSVNTVFVYKEDAIKLL